MARTHRRRRPSLLHGSPEALAALGSCLLATPAQIREQQRRVAEAASVTRFVVTHLNRFGFRELAFSAQGRDTYATPEEAQAWIDAAVENNGLERLAEFYGLPLAVRAVPCWPGHFDPKTVYPAEEE